MLAGFGRIAAALAIAISFSGHFSPALLLFASSALPKQQTRNVAHRAWVEPLRSFVSPAYA
jgi:hypothetical protein